MIMYHGSYMNFNCFTPSIANDGVYFTSDFKYAIGYALVKSKIFNTRPLLYTVKLKILNPYILNGDIDSVFKKYTERGYNINDLKNNGYDGIIIKFSSGEYEAMVLKQSQITILNKSKIFNYNTSK